MWSKTEVCIIYPFIPELKVKYLCCTSHKCAFPAAICEAPSVISQWDFVEKFEFQFLPEVWEEKMSAGNEFIPQAVEG